MTLLAVAVAGLVLLSALALTTRQPPPPTISEFAPKALEQITEAPQDQTAGGRGAGAGGPGAGQTPSPSPTPQPGQVEVARVRRCVGDPPRQIEDPQSPPCVPYWAGDNGGATWRGVTRDTISVAFPQGSSDAITSDWEAFFNNRFEFYGRKIDLIPTGADFAGFGSREPPESSQRAAAVKADEQYKVFASTDTESYGGQAYRDELARRGIVSTGHQTQFGEAYLASRHPYMWQYPMANDRAFALLGSWICARLAGGNAVHSSDPFLQGRRRVFGVLGSGLGATTTVDTSPLDGALRGCGERSAETVQLGSVNEDQSAARDRAAVIRLQQAKVTSVVCLCYVTHLTQVMAQATSQGYFPEWLIGNYYLTNLNWTTSLHPREQTANLFGINYEPKDVRFGDDPAVWALKAANPAYSDASTYNTSSTRQQLLEKMYRDVLLLASGIQLAGPRLTPESFAAGLQRARFPNPVHPIMAGSVGFDSPADHSMTQDAAEMWWSGQARAPYSGDSSGAFCYVDGGARRTRWTAGDPFFTGSCDSGA